MHLSLVVGDGRGDEGPCGEAEDPGNQCVIVLLDDNVTFIRMGGLNRSESECSSECKCQSFHV